MKTVEEIRKQVGMTQKEFAETIGTSFRTYQGRLAGSQPKWLLSEVIKASQMNDGEVLLETEDGIVEIRIKVIE